jgi:thioredoxin-like negative regulator of GroEL
MSNTTAETNLASFTTHVENTNPSENTVHKWTTHEHVCTEIQKLALDPTSLAVIDFSAAWCRPCKVLEPKLHAMANNYQTVTFATVDVDLCPDTAEQFSVSAMPTLVLLLGGVAQLNRTVVGADIVAVQTNLDALLV